MALCRSFSTVSRRFANAQRLPVARRCPNRPLSTGSSQGPMATIQQMHVTELADALANPILLADDGVQLVDVREPEEHQIASLPGFKLFPLSQAQAWAPKIEELLDPQRETIVLCHHGVRSMSMAQLLVSRGFQNVKNVTGGIHAYSMGADPSIPTY